MLDEAVTSEVSKHVRETAEAIAALHAAHHKEATLAERVIETLVAQIASAVFFVSTTLFVFGWVTVNFVLSKFGPRAFDPPPFLWLQGISTVLALITTLSILAAQRRASILADLRAQITLEHSILAEQKAAKMIELLEELRRDDPLIADRSDPQAERMASPTDTETVAGAIRKSHESILKGDSET